MTKEAVPKARIRYTAIDVICREYAQDLENELKDMLDTDIIDFSNSEVFQRRTAAAKRVLLRMPDGERENVYRKVEAYKKMGLLADVQRK